MRKINFFTHAILRTLYSHQYPNHVRTAASNVTKSLPLPPILWENEAAAANFVGK